MPASILELFRALSSFSPQRRDLRDAPWEEFSEWAINHGVAPLCAYNLEYRLAGAGAPRHIRERLLSVYQGSVNDNVMKLVNFKRAVDDLEGRKILLLGAASFAEALYPHIAFRPVLDIELRVSPEDLDPFSNFLGQAQFRPSEDPRPPAVTRVLSDSRTALYLYTSVLGARRAQQEAAILDRALPMRMYGPSMYRVDLEDALLLAVLQQAREGYDVPALSFLDLRELLQGAPSLGGPYSRPVNFDAIRARAAEWRIEKALYASLGIVEALFPETADAVAQAKPKLAKATKALLDRLVVQPWSTLSNDRQLRGADRLRRLLTGGA